MPGLAWSVLLKDRMTVQAHNSEPVKRHLNDGPMVAWRYAGLEYQNLMLANL